MDKQHRKEYIKITSDNYEIVEKYFTNMAEKGWMLEKITDKKQCIFSKCQPKTVRFLFIPFGSDFEIDSVKMKTTDDMVQYVENIGWKKIGNVNDIYAFYAEDNDVKDINLDKKVLKSILKDKRPYNVWVLFMLLFLNSIFLWKLDILDFFNGYEMSHFLVFFILFEIIGILDIIRYVIWTCRFKYNFKKNGRITPYSKAIKYRLKYACVFIVIMLCEILCAIAHSKLTYITSTSLAADIVVAVILASLAYIISMFILKKQRTIEKVYLIMPIVVFVVYNIMHLTVGKTQYEINKRIGDYFSLKDENVFLKEWKVNDIYGTVERDFLVKKCRYVIKYKAINGNDNEIEENCINYTTFNFIIYSTKYNKMHDKLLNSVSKNGKFENDLDLCEAFQFYGDLKEVEELESDDVKVYYATYDDNISHVYDYTLCDGKYMIYDNESIILLETDFVLTETQMDIIIDSMKSMEEKL